MRQQSNKFKEFGGVVMGEPTKCKHCGADARADDYGWRAECGSWDFGYGLWSRGDGCYLRCAWRSQGLELDELRKRIDAAISRAGQATVFGFEHSSVRCVFASNLVEVVEILRGNGPINSEGLG